MYEIAVEENSYTIQFLPDQNKTQEMCDDAVRRRPLLLLYVPDQFVTQEQLKLWHDGNDDDNDDNEELIEWYENHQKRKAQEAKIEKELMPTAWHP